MIDKKEYAYDLPEELIAREPAVPRDASRLLVYDTQRDTVTFGHFDEIHRFLPPDTFLVLNETKVLPSRIVLRKITGGRVKALFLVNERAEKEHTIRLFIDRKVGVGDKLFFNDTESVTVTGQDEHLFTAAIPFSRSRLYELLKEQGTMPIPLYIKNTPLNERELRDKYQTVFARRDGSSAAPTASLHFTDEVFAALRERSIETFFVTLHVGMGTFAPVTEKELTEKKLHKEWYEIPEATLRKVRNYKDEGRSLTAAGTTVVRTLESYAATGNNVGETDLFIYPPFTFRMIDHLITNFHLPESSLMMLVEAFLQFKGAKRRLIDLYRIATGERFRFYSFGDAMLIL